VGFIHALLDIPGMTFDDDKFNPTGQTDFIELTRRRLPPVFTFFDRNAVNAIEKIPTTGLFHLKKCTSKNLITLCLVKGHVIPFLIH